MKNPEKSGHSQEIFRREMSKSW